MCEGVTICIHSWDKNTGTYKEAWTNNWRLYIRLDKQKHRNINIAKEKLYTHTNKQIYIHTECKRKIFCDNERSLAPTHPAHPAPLCTAPRMINVYGPSLPRFTTHPPSLTPHPTTTRRLYPFLLCRSDTYYLTGLTVWLIYVEVTI